MLAQEELGALNREIELLPELRARGITKPEAYMTDPALDIYLNRGELPPDYERDSAVLKGHGFHMKRWESEIETLWNKFSV